MRYRRYLFFGLWVECNFQLSDTEAVNTRRKPDIRVTFRGFVDKEAITPLPDVWYVSQFTDHSGKPQSIIYTSQHDGFRFYKLVFADGVEITLDTLLWHVEVYWPRHYQAQDAAIYVTGPLIGLILRLRHIVVLHGSAVVVEGQAVGFIGPAGTGKSTTAAAFAKYGHMILTDDLSVVSIVAGQCMVYPGHSRLCLWPSALEALFGEKDHDNFDRISPNDPGWDKRYFDLTRGRDQLQRTPLPLLAIYSLGARSGTVPEVEIVPTTKTQALLDLLAARYGALWPLDNRQSAEFGDLAWVADKVPVRSIIRSDSLSLLDHLVAAVLADLVSLQQNKAVDV